MRDCLRVAFVVPEISPFAKSGELADMAGTLPKFLACRGVEVFLFLPRYRRPEIEALAREPAAVDLPVPLGEEKVKATVWRSELDRYPLFLVDHPRYFFRDNIYGPSKGDYPDNDERFAFFSRAVLEFMLKERMRVDVIHCHNWPAALIPLFLRTRLAQKPLFRKTATVLTIHNAAYQGEYPPESLALTGLNWSFFNSEELAFDGKFNFLKAGILFADAVNTVSGAYKREILADRDGPGLRDILRRRGSSLTSVRNGIDPEEWDPGCDPAIAAPYGPGRLEGKRASKRALIEEFGLNLAEDRPLVGIVSYLTRHKGFDLLPEALPALMALGAGLVVLGKGDEQYEGLFKELEAAWPGRIAVKLEASPSLHHKVMAGSDIYLMPSLHEPCGLGQLQAMRYGTVPVVRATGGLEETVVPFDPATLEGTGFLFKDFTARALADALREAVACYEKPAAWTRCVENGLRQDFSMAKAALGYIRLYRKSLEIRRGGRHGR